MALYYDLHVVPVCFSGLKESYQDFSGFNKIQLKRG